MLLSSSAVGQSGNGGTLRPDRRPEPGLIYDAREDAPRGDGHGKGADC